MGGGARYDFANYDAATYGVDVRELYNIEIKGTGGVNHFAGQIVRIEFERKSKDVVYLKCNCSDYTSILDRTVIPSATFTGQSDRAILQSLFAAYCPQISALTANIAIATPIVGYFEVKEKTLRQAVEDLCNYTGAEWRVDYDKNFKYFVPSTYPAPFGLSSAPNKTTTFGIDALTKYTRDFIRPINRCTVLGGILPGGVEISQTYDDPISQLQYEVYSHTIVDREITVAADAMLRAKVTVQENAYPEESFTLSTIKDGLDVGQSLPVYHKSYNIDGNYIIRSMRLKQVAPDTTQYDIELGVKPPDEIVLLRQLEARSRRSTQIPTAVPAAGSVTDASVGIGGFSASVIGTVNATSIIGAINSTQINSVNAASIAGVITAGQIGSVNATTIQGVIVSQQVADNLIDRLSMYATALRPIPTLDAFPPLPDPNYPDGSYVYRKDQDTFYIQTGGAWGSVSSTSAVSGKLEFYHIGTITAGSIIGLIAAGQIGAVNASAITGQVSAGQISTVNATAIQGTLTSSQIGSIAASSITGTLTASQIGTVSAGSITGTLTSAQIASVSASTISGTLNSTQIGSINAATITIGLVQNSQIGGVSASKLTAGTIDANVINVINLNASSITTGTFAADRIGAGTVNVGTGITFSGNGTITFNNIGGIDVSYGVLDIYSDTHLYGWVKGDGGFRDGFGNIGGSATVNYAKAGGGTGTITFSQGLYISST